MPTPENVRIFRNARSFRAWLEKNHARLAVMWVGFHNQRTTKKSITYKDAVDEALCFGWIDGVRISIDNTTFTIRFTPRKAKSNWSQVNLKRMRDLIDEGRVTAAGLAAYEARPRHQRGYSYETRPTELPPDLARQFRKNKNAWEFFSSQAPWYRRTSIYWVVSAKQDATRQRRLATLIDDSAHQRRLRILTPKSKRTT
jgi:uncharacterized protein YdeI (YjbR/CyaY-like superfamily)